jgi:CheY-like chemotaxis protein
METSTRRITGPLLPVPRLRPRVLCVDDEVNVLEGLKLHLRKSCDVVTAISGLAALEVVRATPDFAVILSDMRMPGLNGAAFLSYSRKLAPDAVRLLLTG